MNAVIHLLRGRFRSVVAMIRRMLGLEPPTEPARLLAAIISVAEGHRVEWPGEQGAQYPSCYEVRLCASDWVFYGSVQERSQERLTKLLSEHIERRGGEAPNARVVLLEGKLKFAAPQVSVSYQDASRGQRTSSRFSMGGAAASGHAFVKKNAEVHSVHDDGESGARPGQGVRAPEFAERRGDVGHSDGVVLLDPEGRTCKMSEEEQTDRADLVSYLRARMRGLRNDRTDDVGADGIGVESDAGQGEPGCAPGDAREQAGAYLPADDTEAGGCAGAWFEPDSQAFDPEEDDFDFDAFAKGGTQAMTTPYGARDGLLSRLEVAPTPFSPVLVGEAFPTGVGVQNHDGIGVPAAYASRPSIGLPDAAPYRFVDAMHAAFDRDTDCTWYLTCLGDAGVKINRADEADRVLLRGESLKLENGDVLIFPACGSAEYGLRFLTDSMEEEPEDSPLC